MPKQLTTEEFIKKAIVVHGNCYGYSLVNYVRAHEQVIIHCSIHGIFNQKAYAHLQGRGCLKCGTKAFSEAGNKKKRLTREDFINRAIQTHGDLYNYEKANYTALNTKVDIICKQHGAFKQTPQNHISGRGCRKCAFDQIRESKMISFKEFVKRSNSVHHNRYSYPQQKRTKGNEKVVVICRQHGSFSKVVTQHLQGEGCPTCARLEAGRTRRGWGKLKGSNYLELAIQVHKNQYTYNNLTPDSLSEDHISINCPKHGEFKKRVYQHLQGGGCPKCANGRRGIGGGKSWSECSNGRVSILYLIKVYNQEELFYKIGITFISIQNRYKNKRLMPYSYDVVATYESNDASAIAEWKKSILSTFEDLSYHPKISFAGQYECFSQCEPILKVMPFGTRFYD